MSNAVVQPTHFSPANLSIGQVKLLDSGAKQAYINYSGHNFISQFGSLAIPYGLNVFDKSGPVKYSVDVSLRGYDENPKVKAIYDMLTALDEYMIDQGVKNSRAWFKADLTRDVVKAFYTPCVKWSKDAEGNVKPYPPTLKLNLRTQKKRNENDPVQFDVQIYDENRRQIEGVPLKDLLARGSAITALAQCTSVWFAGSKFGLSWKTVQIRMDKVADGIHGYGFVGDDEHAVVASRQPAGGAGARNDNRFSGLEEDEDDSNEMEDDAAFSAPAPAPAAAPKKQSVLTAMLPPAAAPAPVAAVHLDDEADDAEPIPVPKKPATTTLTKKKIVTAAKKA